MKKLLAAVTVLAVSTAQADTIYVDDDAGLRGDGSSWGMAYKFLQDALAAAVDGDEIQLAQGVYKPRGKGPVGRRPGWIAAIV